MTMVRAIVGRKLRVAIGAYDSNVRDSGIGKSTEPPSPLNGRFGDDYGEDDEIGNEVAELRRESLLLQSQESTPRLRRFYLLLSGLIVLYSSFLLLIRRYNFHLFPR
ncbi:hypothetical protein L1987_43737 [Smallanthus sonchifolius]|uniref:Uncharacterized protein n=1 Tax=Smallanthus sonchifolius TaxID=185202 RepID=A0ACB9GMD3_9ASTR|nr:hypothetical protein L1987_43737 [Smallanthus sonchifolius]